MINKNIFLSILILLSSLFVTTSAFASSIALPASELSGLGILYMSNPDQSSNLLALRCPGSPIIEAHGIIEGFPTFYKGLNPAATYGNKTCKLTLTGTNINHQTVTVSLATVQFTNKDGIFNISEFTPTQYGQQFAFSGTITNGGQKIYIMSLDPSTGHNVIFFMLKDSTILSS